MSPMSIRPRRARRARPPKLLFPGIAVVLLAAALAAFFMLGDRSLSGVVRDAATHRPIAGAVIAGPGVEARTNLQGEYALSLPRGVLTLTIGAEGYRAADERVDATDLWPQLAARDVELARRPSAEAVKPVEQATPTPAPTPTPSQMVNVVDQYTKRPVAGAQVQIEANVLAADAQGRAVLPGVAPGTSLRISAAGYESASATYTGGNVLVALRPNTLDGTVTDKATGKPISNTLVYLGSSWIATNGQGAFHFDNVPASPTLVFKAPGYAKLEAKAIASARRDAQLVPFLVKGIHIPFGIKAAQVMADMDLVGKTELNAIVVDVKAEKGRVNWETQVPLAKEISATYQVGVDLTDVVERCKAENIYCIARLPVFQDTRLATTRPKLALHYPNGKAFTESGDRGWTDPTNPAVWDYNIALAKEAAALGFDEIQFDYVRFPGRQDGLYAGTTATEQGRVDAITGFLARAQKELHPTGVFVSVDVFGLTVAMDDDQGTGQRLRDLGPYVDYISPMVYPAVWTEGPYLLSKGLQIQSCADAVKCPYEVIFNSYKRAVARTSAPVRLWLQAYAGKGNFGVAEYRKQKEAAEDAGSRGWMFWNASGVYDPNLFAK